MSPGEFRERAARLRSIPLQAVLVRLAARRDPCDRAKWHTPRGVLSVNGAKFMNWSRSAGGGGAIDLVMELCDVDFKAAAAWLSLHFHAPPPCEAPRRPSGRRLELPQADCGKLARIWGYLTVERHLPPGLVEALIESGRLYADRRANAVFVLLSPGGAPAGAEIRGTSGTAWHAMARGSRKDLGYFSSPASGGEADSIVLCESAIDALSCSALAPRRLCISTAGARPRAKWLPRLLQSGLPLYCGFDADPTGDAMARALIARYPRVKRLRPALGDWNDVLRHRA